MVDKCATLTEKAIEYRKNNNKGICFIKGENEEKFLSYSDLYNNATYILYHLQSEGIKAGDKLIFQIRDQDNDKFLQVFWACILGKIIPVPLVVAGNDNMSKLFYILKMLEEPKVILDKKTLDSIAKFAINNDLGNEFEYISMNSIFIDEITHGTDRGTIENCKPDDIAFIQFTSGTTGKPKGVVLTHKNLITNINGIISSVCMEEEDILLTWMPLAHDMGMIGFHLVPFYSNMNQYNMPTTLFVRNPILWIKKVNQYRANLLGSSNFGFRYFLDHLKEKEFVEWDLSCIRKIFNGAEPISIDLIDEFINRLDMYGLKKSAMYPVYGMAEASLAVTFPSPDEEYCYVNVDRESLGIGDEVIEYSSNTNNTSSIKFVEEGYPVNGSNIRIVDDLENELKEKIVGHIQINGENVTKKYYANEELTREITSRNGWLDTGDVGFIIRGKLVVVGRYKELINVNGRSYYPHDLESICEKVSGVDSGRVVICGIYNEAILKQKLITFVLHKKNIKDFVSISVQIKKLLKENMEICVDAVIPVRKFPKTTSGKFQRYILIEEYSKGKYDDSIKEMDEELAKLNEVNLWFL